jgi:hypothetical protein
MACKQRNKYPKKQHPNRRFTVEWTNENRAWLMKNGGYFEQGTNNQRTEIIDCILCVWFN